MRHLIFIIFMLLSVVSNAQLTREEVQKVFDARSEKISDILLNFRYKKERNYKDLYKDNSSFFGMKKYDYPDYLNMDLSIDALCTDSIKSRALQLLKNEFYEGELEALVEYHADVNYQRRNKMTFIWQNLSSEMWRNESLRELLEDTTSVESKHFVDSCMTMHKTNKRNDITAQYYYELNELLRFCGRIHDEKISQQLELMLKDTALVESYENIRLALVEQEVEPYFSAFLDSCKYDIKSERGPNDEKLSVELERKELKLIEHTYCEKAFRLLADYLVSGRYYETFDIEDNTIIEENDSVTGVNYYDEAEWSEMISASQRNSYQKFYNVYLYQEAVLYFKLNMKNMAFWKYVSSQFKSNKDVYNMKCAYLYDKKIRWRMYKWLCRHYGHYNLPKRW